MRSMLKCFLALAVALPTVAFAAGDKCPNVVIVLDKSGSMDWTPSGSSNTSSSNPSRMTIAHQVIADVLLGQNGAPPPSPLVRFGYTIFPSDNGCGGGFTSRDVPVGYGTEQSIVTSVNATTPNGSTPTGPKIETLIGDASMTDSSRPRYIILVTDGEPTCTLNNGSTGDASDDAVKSVRDAATEGVTTFVVGFGSGTAGSSTLDDMAAAGNAHYADGGAITTAFQASDASTLSTALAGIIQAASQGELGGTGSCNPCLDRVGTDACPSGQSCNPQTGACQTDPYAACLAATCAAGQYCHVNAQGAAVCATACAGPCGAGQVCADDGTCQADPCGSGGCGCGAGTVPDNSGNCVPNQCGKIQCPSGSFCSDNACAPLFASTTGNTSSGNTTSASTTGGSGSSGTTSHNPNGNVTSSGGCSSGSGAALAGMGLVMLAMLGWRRRD